MLQNPSSYVWQEDRTFFTNFRCGGKSEGISCIYDTFKQVSAPFFIVPEAATIIGSSGLTLDFSNFTGEQIQLFQIYLMRLQYNLEGILEDVAKTLEKLGKCPVILCDRGLLDGKAYAGK